MIGLKNRESLDSTIADEFENLVSQFRALFLVEHKEDGTHITEVTELALNPVGAIQQWLTGTAPTGWLLLDGTQINRLTYQGLFNLWGTTYGVGDGSTTFNLPDMRGRFFLGKAAAGTGSVLGGTGGAIDHTHTGGAHTHTISSQAGHTHAAGTLAGPSHTHGAGTLAGPSHTHGAGTLAGPSHTHTTPNHTHTISGSTGSESAHTHTYSGDTEGETLFGIPTISNYEDYSFDSEFDHKHAYSGTTSGGSSHSHTSGTLAAVSGGGSTTGSDGTGSVTGSTGSAGTGSVTGSTGSDGVHDHGGVTGSDSATTGSNNPPFLVGNYIAYSGVR